ncbi:MAG: ABC transporter ATP-binding protein [Sulfuricella sp.]|nr:ABC transporter ATP-binding protein [Sulfuricella sp.]
MKQGSIEVTDVSVTITGARQVQAVKDITFSVEAAKFVSFLGTSGCGKSTILNVLAGFIQPTRGSATLDGNLIVGPGRDRGIVFQHHALFPWMTVWDNVAYGLRCNSLPNADVIERTRKFIELVGLQRFANAYPGELSGGMQQRVGIARVMVNNPTVLLMDEPFGALDAQTRLIMQELLLQIFRDESKTVVFVTHDIDEGILLSDTLYVLTALPGQIKACIDVDIPRPRDRRVFELPRFIQIKKQVMELIREETMKSLL